MLLALSCFFLVFGIDLLIGAYSLENPFNFIMTFFAASLVILISTALGISFVIRMVRVHKSLNNKNSMS